MAVRDLHPRAARPGRAAAHVVSGPPPARRPRCQRGEFEYRIVVRAQGLAPGALALSVSQRQCAGLRLACLISAFGPPASDELA